MPRARRARSGPGAAHDAALAIRVAAHPELFHSLERCDGQRPHSALGYLSPRLELRSRSSGLRSVPVMAAHCAASASRTKRTSSS